MVQTGLVGASLSTRAASDMQPAAWWVVRAIADAAGARTHTAVLRENVLAQLCACVLGTPVVLSFHRSTVATQSVTTAGRTLLVFSPAMNLTDGQLVRLR